MTLSVAFLVNPIAGMGGRVGLKGTDGVIDKAISLGAHPISMERSIQALSTFSDLHSGDITWITCAGDMGETVLKKIGFTNYSIIYNQDGAKSSAEDTKQACKRFLEKAPDIILFCGGDGTARDIVEIIDKKIPILGIPSGVKMHSAVFGITPEASAKMLHAFANNQLRKGDAEIMDLDETLYRKGEWKVRMYATAVSLVEPNYIQVGKAVFSELSETDVKDEISEHIEDEMNQHPDTLFLFGAGGTIEYIAKKLGLADTVLGIDAVIKGKTIATDINEQKILDLLDKHKKAKIIVSPIGAQGFIFGRGNLQFSPKVIRRVGFDNIIVVSTPAKVLATPLLRVDTGDRDLDRLFADYEMIMVVIGYRLHRVIRIQAV